MPQIPFTKQMCDCGTVLIFSRPEDREPLQNLVDMDKEGRIALILLDQTAAPCPKCGKLYLLPPAEILDPERYPLGRLMQEIDKKASKA